MEEIQRKSILVRVSARLELARVRVIGSQLSLFLTSARLVSLGCLWIQSIKVQLSFSCEFSHQKCPLITLLLLKIEWASLIFGSKFTDFSLFYFVFEGNFPGTSPRGAYIWRGDLTEGFLSYRFHFLEEKALYLQSNTELVVECPTCSTT